MKRFKYDLHVHTAQSSQCAKDTGSVLVEKYIDAGYSGFVVSDHFIGSPSCVVTDNTWENKINRFCEGYYDAKECGYKKGFNVFFGLEFFYYNTEFVIINLEPETLVNLGESITKLDLADSLRMFRDAGAFTIHAHPFRVSRRINTIRLLPDLTDAVEVINGENNFMWPEANRLAQIYAKEFKKIAISSSDFHGGTGIISGGMAFSEMINTCDELVKNLTIGSAELINNSLF